MRESTQPTPAQKVALTPRARASPETTPQLMRPLTSSCTVSESPSSHERKNCSSGESPNAGLQGPRNAILIFIPVLVRGDGRHIR
jgi:hypothetical protein